MFLNKDEEQILLQAVANKRQKMSRRSAHGRRRNTINPSFDNEKENEKANLPRSLSKELQSAVALDSFTVPTSLHMKDADRNKKHQTQIFMKGNVDMDDFNSEVMQSDMCDANFSEQNVLKQVHFYNHHNRMASDA